MQNFPIHPLDVTDMQIVTSPDGTRNFTVCTNAFTDIGDIGQGETLNCVFRIAHVLSFVSDDQDALFGDSFLRNIYAAYVLRSVVFPNHSSQLSSFGHRFDFGTGGPTKGTPFVQMLSSTDTTKSAADLINVRRQTMASMPPELSPADLVKVFNGTLGAAAAVPVTTAAAPPPSTVMSASGSSPTSGGGGSGSGTGTSNKPASSSKNAGVSMFEPVRKSVSVVGGVVLLLAITSLF